MAGAIRLDQAVGDRAVQGDARSVAAEVHRVVHPRLRVDAARVPAGPLPVDVPGAAGRFVPGLTGRDPDDPAVLMVDDLVEDLAGLVDVEAVRALCGRARLGREDRPGVAAGQVVASDPQAVGLAPGAKGLPSPGRDDAVNLADLVAQPVQPVLDAVLRRGRARRLRNADHYPRRRHRRRHQDGYPPAEKREPMSGAVLSIAAHQFHPLTVSPHTPLTLGDTPRVASTAQK